MYKLCFYVPQTHLESVKTALFEKGAGRIGDYDCCCWQVLGQGQFKPLAGSNPYLGQQGSIERVEEYKVEMVCDDSVMSAVIRQLLATHPYEEPAYEIYPLVDPKMFSAD